MSTFSLCKLYTGFAGIFFNIAQVAFSKTGCLTNYVTTLKATALDLRIKKNFKILQNSFHISYDDFSVFFHKN